MVLICLVKVQRKVKVEVGRKLGLYRIQSKLYRKASPKTNTAVEFSVLCENSSNLFTSLRNMKSVKRKLFSEFTLEL